MSKFTMIFLYSAGSLLFGLSIVALLASIPASGNEIGRAFGGMIAGAVIMGIGAIISVLRKIEENTARAG